MTDHAHGHGLSPGGAADSAGQPWAGREFHANPAAGDDGSAPAALVDAIGRAQAGEASPAVVLEAFGESRLLIPLLAVAGDVGETTDGRLVDKTQELSIVTVAGPDGRRVMPVFTSVAAMSAWNPQARPVPVAGTRVALAAASEQTELVVIDPTGPTEFVLRRPALWSLAQSRAWVPCYLDAELLQAFLDAAMPEADVHAVELAPGDPRGRLAGPELIVGLRVADGLTHDELTALLNRLTERWRASALISERVDSMSIKLIASA